MTSNEVEKSESALQQMDKKASENIALLDCQNRNKFLLAKLKAKEVTIRDQKNRIAKLDSLLYVSPGAKMKEWKIKFISLGKRHNDLKQKHAILKRLNANTEDRNEKLEKAIQEQLGKSAWAKVQYYIDKVY